jgi:outer membrane lipoprotein SlyB
MSTVLSSSGAAAATGNKFLWGAVGVLGASTLALGATLLYQHNSIAPVDAPLEVVAIRSPAPSTPAASEPVDVSEKSGIPQALPAATPSASAKPDSKVLPAPVSHGQATSKVAPHPKVVKAQAPAAKSQAGVQVATGTAVTVPPVVVPAPVQLPAKVVCAHCGVVETVTPIQRESANPSGAGAVAGAVLGGLVGNQFGGGDGKALATIAGVLGGGWAGNTVEKRLKKDTVYLIEVRMEDGSLRSIEQATSTSVGQHVTVEGNSITPARSPSERNPAPFNSAS